MSRKIERNKYTNSLCSLYLLLIVSLCICSCTSEYNILDNDNSKILNFSVSVPLWKNNYSTSNNKTRATLVSGSSFDKASSFNIIADTYDGNSSYSTIINNETVSFNNSMWKTATPHYWPGIATNTVSFYAYYPANISNSITHTAGSYPTLSYTVPDDVASQIDIMTASGKNISGNTNSSTPLSFNHIFAAVKFSIGSAGMPNGTITGVALNNILYKGTYSLNGTWTLDATSKKTFSQAVSSSTNAGTTITSGTTTFMMIPQTLGSDASITVTYSNGGTLTQSITGTWNAGKIYTYSISKTIPIVNFDYTGNIQTYTVPLTGTYKLEVWGASGATYEGVLLGGDGGYTFGNIKLTSGQNIYICVGGIGNWGTYTGAGYNGGGNSGGVGGSGGGGGATNITMTNNRGVLSNYVTNQNEVLIVAGGGGGGDSGGNGGSGGGISGGNVTGALGGNQTAGYAFGKGESPSISSDGAGGGGGWFGGFSTTNNGAGGGSGYLNSFFISGTTGTQNGVRTGNGYARITFISAN
jgi:hypothetical protein